MLCRISFCTCKTDTEAEDNYLFEEELVQERQPPYQAFE